MAPYRITNGWNGAVTADASERPAHLHASGLGHDKHAAAPIRDRQRHRKRDAPALPARQGG